MKFTIEQRKAEALNLIFEMKKQRIKTEQRLNLVETTTEKQRYLNYLKKVNKALIKLENYL